MCVLVPGTDVLLAEPDVPVKAGAKLPQLVPYALEEQLADDIDDLHFAIGKRTGDSHRVPVAVVTRALLDEWLATLRGAGLEPEALYADSELLPQNPGQAVALLEEDAVFVRPPGGTAGHPAGRCARRGARDRQVRRRLHGHRRAGPDPLHGRRRVAAACRRRSRRCARSFDGIKIQLLTGGPLALFAQQLPGGSAINLLQGTYTPTTARAVGLQGLARRGHAARRPHRPAHRRQGRRAAAC